MILVYLFLTSWLSCSVSALAGGGSPLILIPLVGFLLGPQVAVPTITLGMLMGNCQRLWLFWQYVKWDVILWYVPGAILGSILGAYVFTKIDVEWLQLPIGIFLILEVITFFFSKKEQCFGVKSWYFLPGGFIQSAISGLIGGSGPIINPLYLNYNLVKEEMVATKSVALIVNHLVKLITYYICGVLKPEYMVYGLIIGLGAIPGNFLGQFLLKKVSEHLFRYLVLIVMFITGSLMIWQQRGILGLY